MKRGLIHPWWVHLPAGVVWIGFAALGLLRIERWPARVPLGFGWDGTVRSWGSPWISFGMVLGLGLLFLALGVLMDELWARQEREKRFNVLSLLDELVIGLLVGIQGGMMLGWRSGSQAGAIISWEWAIGVMLAALVLGIWAEHRRPFVSSPAAPSGEDVEAFSVEVRRRTARGERLVYWDVQNPAYMSWLSLGLPLAFWAGAAASYGSEPWAAVLLAILGLAFIMFYGGQRTRITNDEITIRYGLMGVRVFRCGTRAVTSVRVRTFAALREFGGYGIRLTSSSVGYFLCGSRGVQLEIAGRRDALIGSRHPERLAEVIRAASGAGTAAGSGVESEGGRT